MADQYFEHVTVEGERWDHIAHKYYGNARKYNVIKQANPSVSSVAVLDGNLTLKIPIIEAEAADQSLLPPWKRQ